LNQASGGTETNCLLLEFLEDKKYLPYVFLNNRPLASDTKSNTFKINPFLGVLFLKVFQKFSVTRGTNFLRKCSSKPETTIEYKPELPLSW
jgi:hypothetical protein